MQLEAVWRFLRKAYWLLRYGPAVPDRFRPGMRIAYRIVDTEFVGDWSLMEIRMVERYRILVREITDGKPSPHTEAIPAWMLHSTTRVRLLD